MKKIAIIGANSFQNPLILKAKELGYETHVFAWQCGDVGERNADHFYPISIVEKEEILEVCRGIKPDGIATAGSDLAVLTVNYVARALGLPANSELCDRIATDKYEMRKAFRENGIAVPGFTEVTEADWEEKTKGFRYPLIVKPVDRSGSRAISKVYTKEELKMAVQAAVDQAFRKTAIVEEYISGNEYSCECISYHGEHHYLTVTKKFTTDAPHFIETGHLQPAGLTKAEEEMVKREIFRALTALHIENSAAHAEFRISPEGQVRIIEIGARMGGDCIGSDLVPLSTGYDFLKMVIDVSVGNEPQLIREHEDRAAAIRFFMKPDEISLLEKAKNGTFCNVVKTELPEADGEENEHQVTDSSTRLGFFIMNAPLEYAEKLKGDFLDGEQ